MKLLILSVFLTVVSFFIADPVSAANLLQNGGFETANSEPWSSSGGGATATVSAELKRNGNYSLKVQHSKDSAYGFQQAVSTIEGSKYYKVEGYVATSNSETKSYFIRLAWYDSSNNQTTIDTSEVTQTDSNWVQIQEVFQAPDDAVSAKVRLVLKSKNNGTTAFAYFDDITFEQVADPTPTSTPTDEPTSTPISTPTPSKTPTPTNPPAGRTTPTKKVSPTSTKEPTITLPPALLGTSSAVTETPSPTPQQTIVAGFSLGNILIFAGGLVFILSGILVFTFIAKREAR